jgi:DASS family divalent anion:Na+ symporter
MTTGLHSINYAVVALVGICVLLLTGVLSWSDVISETGAWDVFIWYGGLVRMAEALGETGITKRFADPPLLAYQSGGSGGPPSPCSC